MTGNPNVLILIRREKCDGTAIISSEIIMYMLSESYSTIDIINFARIGFNLEFNIYYCGN